MDFAAMPSDREVRQKHVPVSAKQPAKQPDTNSHRRGTPASPTTSQVFRAPQILPGGAALEAKTPTKQPAIPAAPSPTAGSDALRGIFTDKIDKAKTTARIRKNQITMEAFDLAVRQPNAVVTRLSITDQLAGILPALLIFGALVALIIIYAIQPR